jgi:flavin-dependent dehydrogenase
MVEAQGHGVLLDRARFDRELEDELRARGLRLADDRVQEIAGSPGAWTIGLASGRWLRAERVLIATGRASPRFLGGNRLVRADRMVAIGIEWELSSPLRDLDGGGAAARRDSSFGVVASTNGWWYGVHAPPDRFLAVYLTDADLLPRGWRASLPGAVPPELVDPADRPGDVRQATIWIRAAATQARACAAGAGFALAGDARLALDPLSGAGVSRAIEDGERVGRQLASDPDRAARRELRRRHAAEFGELVEERARQYARQDRFDGPFWQRRRPTTLGPARAEALSAATAAARA